MAVATSTHQMYAKEALKEQGIFDYFQEIITGDCVEHGKPHPAIYALACEKLEVLEDETPVKEYLYGKLKTLEEVKNWMEK